MNILEAGLILDKYDFNWSLSFLSNIDMLSAKERNLELYELLGVQVTKYTGIFFWWNSKKTYSFLNKIAKDTSVQSPTSVSS